VRYLKVIEKSGYQALPWVRYITTGGEYEVRAQPGAQPVHRFQGICSQLQCMQPVPAMRRTHAQAVLLLTYSGSTMD